VTAYLYSLSPATKDFISGAAGGSASVLAGAIRPHIPQSPSERLTYDFGPLDT
jgi:hypothetical protein